MSKSGQGNQYQRSANGEFIIATNDKLIYTDGKFDDPTINGIVTIGAFDENTIDYARRIIYDVEKGKRDRREAWIVLEGLLG